MEGSSPCIVTPLFMSFSSGGFGWWVYHRRRPPWQKITWGRRKIQRTIDAIRDALLSTPHPAPSLLWHNKQQRNKLHELILLPWFIFSNNLRFVGLVTFVWQMKTKNEHNPGSATLSSYWIKITRSIWDLIGNYSQWPIQNWYLKTTARK